MELLEVLGSDWLFSFRCCNSHFRTKTKLKLFKIPRERSAKRITTGSQGRSGLLTDLIFDSTTFQMILKIELNYKLNNL